jgi:SAM-dependent methyltransferase
MALDPFDQFLIALRRAPNETARRELFVALAARAFSESSFATDLALGAEYRVRFESSGLVRRGAIDSFYGNLIVEFEADMARTGAHAKDQLRAYSAGAWAEEGSSDRAFLAVATDGRRWEVYAPRLADPAGPIALENIVLEPIETWQPAGDESDGHELRALLNRLFFRHDLIAPTAENFARDFGISSPAFHRASAQLEAKMAELRGHGGLEVRRRLWREALEIVYGSIQPDDALLVKHTYLAVLARLLVWAAFERRHLSERELPAVLDGSYFVGKRIANLVEDDFFRWHEMASPTPADPIWIGLAKHLAGYDLAAVREDVLKPLYEELVDPVTRQLLGEFYTPDWLATELTARLLGSWDFAGGAPAVIDAACGSGTFLRTSIDFIRAGANGAGNPVDASAILTKVIGVDVHPLAVTIARATYLLAIRDLVVDVPRPITIPVFLANSLRADDVDRRTLFGNRTGLRVADDVFEVTTDFVWDGPRYDAAIDDVLAVARAYGAPEADDLADAPASFAARLGDRLDSFDDPELVPTLGRLASRLADLIRRGEDSVYGFVLKNSNRPAMVRRSFDYVIGNPPWLTVGDIETAAYKELVVQLATGANIAPRAMGDQSHTELATIFLAQAFTEFLNDHENAAPRVGLVMPRSLFSAKHHRLLRQAQYRPRFRITELWDLERVHPLFRIPACVVLAAVADANVRAPIAGREYSGILPAKDLNADDAEPFLRIEDCTYELGFLAERSAWLKWSPTTVGSGTPSRSRNAYRAAFRQGAILYPQTLLSVSGDVRLARGMGPVAVRTDPRATETAKMLAAVDIARVVDSENLYTTAAADNIGPFTLLFPLRIVVLPTTTDPTDAAFAPVSASALRRAGRVESAAWLEWAEAQWASVRKEGDQTPLHERLDYLRQFSGQAGRDRFVVIYAASGSRPVASPFDSAAIDPPFVARDKTYWAAFDSEAEALFVTGYLNSDFLAARIEAWMTRGLFGPRDVHKRALDVPFPAFDPTKPNHLELVAATRRLTDQAQARAGGLAGHAVGVAREAIKLTLDSGDLARLEELVTSLSDSVPEAALGLASPEMH